MTHPVDRISHAEITESFFAFTDDFRFSTSETMNDPFPRELNEALFDSVSKLLLKESTPMSEAADISGRFGLNPEQAWKALELRRLYAYFLLDTDGRRVQLNGEGGPEQYAALAHALRMTCPNSTLPVKGSTGTCRNASTTPSLLMSGCLPLPDRTANATSNYSIRPGIADPTIPTARMPSALIPVLSRVYLPFTIR